MEDTVKPINESVLICTLLTLQYFYTKVPFYKFCSDFDLHEKAKTREKQLSTLLVVQWSTQGMQNTVTPFE
jgi:hypothetical protein